MSKSKILITILVVIAIVGVVLGARELDKRTLSVTLLESGYDVTVYDGYATSGKVITKLTSTSDIRLHDGYYCFKTEQTEVYREYSTCKAVYGSDAEVTIEPRFSDDFLAEKLIAEQPEINALLNTAYAAQLASFTPTGGKLAGDGDWYIGTFVQNVQSPSEQGDVYRFVFKKENAVWQVAAYPQIVLSSVDYPEIPKLVIQQANDL